MTLIDPSDDERVLSTDDGDTELRCCRLPFMIDEVLVEEVVEDREDNLGFSSRAEELAKSSPCAH